MIRRPQVNYLQSYYVVELGFPTIGSAHASGRQGIVYVTENGNFFNLPNNANRTFHITSDIAVLHAPDFSVWRWIELGNPYYEDELPTSIQNPTIAEDYDALPLGFNLHAPYPNPFNSNLNLSFNIFEPNNTNIEIIDALGRKIITIYDDYVQNIGVHKLIWEPKNIKK